MSANSLQDFMGLPPSIDLTDSLGEIYLYHEALTEEQAAELHEIARQHLPEVDQYTADFDLKEEVTAQLTAVRALRAKVIDVTGRAVPGVSARDLKEVVGASNTLLQTLMKTHEKILNYDRQRAIEKATVKVVKQLAQEEQEMFFSTLEAELALIE